MSGDPTINRCGTEIDRNDFPGTMSIASEPGSVVLTVIHAGGDLTVRLRPGDAIEMARALGNHAVSASNRSIMCSDEDETE